MRQSFQKLSGVNTEGENPAPPHAKVKPLSPGIAPTLSPLLNEEMLTQVVLLLTWILTLKPTPAHVSLERNQQPGWSKIDKAGPVRVPGALRGLRGGSEDPQGNCKSDLYPVILSRGTGSLCGQGGTTPSQNIMDIVMARSVVAAEAIIGWVTSLRIV